MHFLPDIYVPCEVCHGARYNRDTLEVTFRGKTIADVLELSCEEALGSSPPSRPSPGTSRPWSTWASATSGSASRRPPCRAARPSGSSWPPSSAGDRPGTTLYVLDEPTTGLHFDDVRKLLDVLNRLVDQGNTVIVIEHNLDVVKSADWIIDMGPEGGDRGGTVVAEGTPEEVAAVAASYTGPGPGPPRSGVVHGHRGRRAPGRPTWRR